MKWIKVDRQSVCMGDDVAAPNEGVVEVAEQDTMREVIKKVAEYLPSFEVSRLDISYILLFFYCQYIWLPVNLEEICHLKVILIFHK